jgi:hypothetical protein
MPDLLLVGLGGAGVVAGLGMLARGFLAQRIAARIEDVATSRIRTLAAGEVQITGTAQAAGVTLTSPVRGRACVYYRATATTREGEGERTLFDEERGVGFFVKDASGEVRVFPSGARWDVTLDEPTPWAEGRAGSGSTLLVPPGPDEDPLHPDRDDLDFAMPILMASAARAGGNRSVTYREGRIEPGDTVTVVGRALPFRDLADPTEADRTGDELATVTGAVDANHLPDPDALEDPEVAASYAEALREGTLAESPAEAWGNAAIEGFGIGRPVRPPELEPGLPSVPAAEAAPAGTVAGSSQAEVGSTATQPAQPIDRDVVERNFELPPDALVITSDPEAPLVIAAGTPVEAAARQGGTFLLGLLGAVLAIASAAFLALVLSGRLGS